MSELLPAHQATRLRAGLIDYLLHEVRHHLHDVGIQAPREGVQEAAAEEAEQAHDQDAGASQ